jgi:hypothetical protein
MGCTDRKIGPGLLSTARRTPPLLYHNSPHLSIGILNKNKKNNWWFSPPIITQIRKRVAVFLVGNIIEKLSVVATITTSHIICGFLPHMGAPHALLFCGLRFRTNETSSTIFQSQSSSSQGALP